MTEWTEWVKQLTPEQVAALSEALVPLGNGSNSVTIVRASVQDKMVLRPVNYVDTYGLNMLYNKVAFRTNLLVKGPKGGGKTLSLINYAQATQTPIVIVECSEGTKPRDFIGSFFLKGGKDTPFILGDIPTAIDIANEYGRCMLLFEEINGLTPQTQKRLNGVLDFRQAISVPQISRSFSLREEAMLWCVASMNPSVYGGTYELNEDLRSRWNEVEISYPPLPQEREIVKSNLPGVGVDKGIIDSCIKLANETRQQGLGYALSTRDVVRIVEDISLIGLANALQLVVCKFEDDDRKTIVRRVNSIFTVSGVTESWKSYR